MPELDDKVSDDTKESFEQMWELHEDVLPADVFDALEAHIDRVEGTNRGRRSSAGTRARKGPNNEEQMDLMINNSAGNDVICHEIGHGLMDALGIDCTQEATERANNKSNWSRWPQFSFGKKDSPAERFMLRRYGDAPELDKWQVTCDNLERCLGFSDIFHRPDARHEWYEAHGYKIYDGRERKRYHDPFEYDGDDPDTVNLVPLNSSGTDYIKPCRDEYDEEEFVVDRYQLTPGLADIVGAEDVDMDWDGLNELLYQVNTHWFESITLVRKRGEARDRGIEKSPMGDPNKSYYVMNCHEYFAQLHAVMMQSEHLNGAAASSYEDHIERLRDVCPGLIEAYEDALR